LSEYQRRLQTQEPAISLDQALRDVAGLSSDKSIAICREVEDFIKSGSDNKKKGPADKSKDFRSFLKQ
jgi:hypothetical protein